MKLHIPISCVVWNHKVFDFFVYMQSYKTSQSWQKDAKDHVIFLYCNSCKKAFPNECFKCYRHENVLSNQITSTYLQHSNHVANVAVEIKSAPSLIPMFFIVKKKWYQCRILMSLSQGTVTTLRRRQNTQTAKKIKSRSFYTI